MNTKDKRSYIPENGFEAVERQMMITVTGDDEYKNQQIFMSHYPMLTWDGSHRGSWQVYGHIHTEKGKKTSFDDKLVPNQYDVGVDNNDYTPVSWQQLKEIITKRNLRG